MSQTTQQRATGRSLEPLRALWPFLSRYKGVFALYQKELPKLPRATLSDVADHIEHVIKVAGIDAVGLGTDFDGIPNPPVGFEDYSKLPDLVKELLRRGRSDAEVKKILGAGKDDTSHAGTSISAPGISQTSKSNDVIYVWEDEFGGKIVIVFQDDKVVQKSKTGLE